MKILCDVHIPYKLVVFLNSKDIQAIHVNTILDKWFTQDSSICRYVDEHDYVLVTKDVDFKNSYFLKHTPRKLIRISLGNIPNDELIKIFAKNLDLFINYFQESDGYIEIDREFINLHRI